MRAELEELLADRAARQHGVVTRRQLLEAGLARSAVTWLLESRRLRPLHRGVYLAVAVPVVHTRELAAVLACGDGAALSHRSAGALWGWPTAPGKRPEVSAVGRHLVRPGILIHRVARLGPEDRTEREGIPLTTPARTLADLAPVLGKAELEGVVARALRDHLIGGDALAGLLARDRRYKGVRRLRTVMAAPGGPALTRSAAEAAFLALVREARLPPPECNTRLGGHEIDFLWPAARLAVEVDGYRYHSSRQSFESDRRRDAELLAQGVTVVRVSWRQITREGPATAALLGMALARAGERR